MASSWGQYDVHPDVLEQARRLGMFGNVEKRVKRMARQAAPFTHPEGNRRFESYILRIEGGVVVSIRQFDPNSGTVTTDIFEEAKRRQKTAAAIDKHFGSGSKKIK